MFNFILKIISLILFSVIIIFFYYSVFNWHLEDFSNLIFYFSFFAFLFWFYKIFQIFLTKEKDEIIFTPFKIFSLFFLVLFFLCFLHFNDLSLKINSNFLPYFSWNLSFENIKNTFSLFWKIILFSLFPIFLFFVTSSFWKKISRFLPNFSDFSKNVKLLFYINFWFFSFLFLVSIFLFFWFFSLKIIFFILFLFLFFSFKEFFSLLKSFFQKKFILEKKDWFSSKLIITEFFYFFSFFVLSTGLIYILRPFPRWRDELWVYMNFPNILSYSSEKLSFWEMFSWQIFTWIWHLFSNTTFAYFINFSWYFFSFLTLNLIFSDIFKYNKKSILNIPIMFSTLFLALPMSIFHSIKDLKLDQGLFFITTFIVYFLFILLKKYKENKDFPKIYLFLIWILSWFSFSIKFTSLFLIISILALFSYFYLWVFWIFAFLFLLFSVFTAWNLWPLMNINFESNIYFIIFSFIFWISFLILWFRKYLNFKKYFQTIFLFLFWILFSLSPWFLKNIFDIYPNISILWIIKWAPNTINLDLKNIYSEKELEKKVKEKFERRKIDPITNEDLKRYLWYESWILPFTNIFWNITMQKNQGWKFTEIWYLFFVFLPLIFVFLSFFRWKNFFFIFIFFSFLQILFFVKTPVFIWKNTDLTWISKQNYEQIFTEDKYKNIKFISEDIWKLNEKIIKFPDFEKQKILEIWDKNKNFLQKIIDFFASIKLPFWYLFVFFIFFSILLFLLHFLKKSEKTFIFRQNLVFSCFYIFFWTISSFAVVWYWITMYFCLFLFIWYGFYYIWKEKNEDFRFYAELSILIIFLSYFIFSLIPHTVWNFKEKNFLDYKIWKTTNLEQNFDLHSNYEKIFFELNIWEENRVKFLEKNIPENILKDEFFPKNWNIEEIIDFLKIKKYSKNKENLLKIYKHILYPEKDYKSDDKIFRIWTFLKYYIYENHKRIFEDGLLFYFYDFIYDKNPEKTVQNFKKLWLKYILLDLWTPTIDDSVKHLLTERYEKFLETLTSKNLDLIDSNDICLRFWFDLSKTEWKTEKILKLLWTTFESYENWRKVLRSEKQKYCSSEIEKFLKTDYDKQKFSYLKFLKNLSKDEIYKKLKKWNHAIFKIKN